jgi:hypothetical protein
MGLAHGGHKAQLGNIMPSGEPLLPKTIPGTLITDGYRLQILKDHVSRICGLENHRYAMFGFSLSDVIF